MVYSLQPECSFTSWYANFKKDALKATVLSIPEEVLKYIEHDAFFLPREVTEPLSEDSLWSDGRPVEPEETSENQPTFPTFSKTIQDVIDDYGAVFIKSNWSCPSDATWVTPTKTLKCKTLEEIYLLLKSSEKIAEDLQMIKRISGNGISLKSTLVLKKWREINPCMEFRCFVIENELIGISQRDTSQHHTYNESEHYNIRMDIKSFFADCIKEKFPLINYSFDIVRYKEGTVKIVDFGSMNESTVKHTLFTLEELHSITVIPEFRFISEEVGIQPKSTQHICIPQEINEFFKSPDKSLLDLIRTEVENQQKEKEERDNNN